MVTKATFVSTLALNQEPLRPLARAQRELANAQVELGNGRRADLVLALGGGTKGLVMARGIVAESETLLSSNVRVSHRLEAAQASLSALSNDAQEFFATVVAGGTGVWNPGLVDREARSSLSSLVSQLGVTVDGAHIFSGTNIGAAPLVDYFGMPPPPSRTAVHTAFTSYFGFPPGDSAAASITATQMTDFLANGLGPVFDDASWQANWSQASNELLTDRITSADEIDSGVSANAVQFRGLAKAYVMMGDLGVAAMSAAARDVVVKAASESAADAIGGLAELQGKIGLDQAIVKDANEWLSARSALVERQILELEGVDPGEISTRIATLLSRIEASYSLAARLHKLSLLEALR